MIIPMNLGKDSYDIILERGCIRRAGELLNLQRKVLIVTDDGVPAAYAQSVAAQCREADIATLPQGESHKNFDSFQVILRRMLAFGMTRKDCVVAVGGGVMGDMAGFAAACYMRGVDFYNIPTTVLSQVDSSIGGKTAIDLDGIKNIVGAFYQPKRVLIDPEVLSTLPDRQIANGMAEAVKMALCFDEEGFQLFESGDWREQTDRIIENALRIKKRVVEEDEKEQGLRKTLNFGHTLGHGIESLHEENGLLHGECVALGMIPMCAPDVRQRLIPVLERLGLPTACDADPDRVMAAVAHDKKAGNGTITAVIVEKAGSCRMTEMTPEELKARYTALLRR
ncbi:MAG: 3-dehydroquinate synthase [Clostridia bacterium]|nr:3-dehydroquinate synthase [Clostridia bacterium]